MEDAPTVHCPPLRRCYFRIFEEDDVHSASLLNSHHAEFSSTERVMFPQFWDAHLMESEDVCVTTVLQ